MRCALLAMLALLAGCSGTSPVTLVVTREGTGEPVRSAHVRAIAMHAGAVPLPLNDTTIHEILEENAEREQGFTDSKGRVRLDLDPAREHLIEVDPPPLERASPGSAPGPGASPTLARWALSADQRTLRPMKSRPGEPPPALRLEVLP